MPAGAFDPFATTTAWLDGLDHEWVGAAQRLSTTVILDLLTQSGEACADRLLSRTPEAAADFAVGWAGEATSRHWMDAGREYTEWWLHQQHIRIAVGAPLLESAEWVGPVLALFAHVLPRAMNAIPAAIRARVRVVLTGEGGGWCELQRGAEAWRLEAVEIGGSSAPANSDADGGTTTDAAAPSSSVARTPGASASATDAPLATLTLAATDAWRLRSRSLRGRAPADVVHVTGYAALAAPLLHAKAIMG